VPDPTTNYGWDVPAVGGDTGAWGTILNLVFDAIDTDLKTVDDRVVVVEAQADALFLARMLILGASGDGAGWAALGKTMAVAVVDVGTGSLTIPLPHLRPGMRITGFSSFAATSAGTLTCSLRKVDVAAVDSEVSAGHAVTGALDSTTGLTEDVVADTAYYLRFVTTDTGQSVIVSFGRVTVEAAP